MMKTKKVKPHNPVAMSPLLRKGGVHEKSKSSRRSKDKLKIQRVMHTYFDFGVEEEI